MTSCELNEIFLGEIASVQNYGAFVRIPGCKQQGLIHKSQVSSSRVDDVADVLQRGERVWCKIINIDDNGKVGLSMKHVNQGNGKDLDPNGAEQRMDEQRRKKIIPGRRRAIELDAILDTTCSKCGTRGHLASDCFMTPDGKKYDLVPEIEETIQRQPTDDDKSVKKEDKNTSSGKESKRRKKSKKKSRRRSDRSEGSSDDDDDDENDDSDERKRRKRKKSKETKRRKKTKKKRRNSDGSSDSDASYGPGDGETKGRRESNEIKSKKCKHSRSKHSD